MLEGKVFVTGGSGTLAEAIIKRAWRQAWPCQFTLFSRDPVKQHRLAARWGGGLRFVLGDVADHDSLYRAMCGHDYVLHLAAQKHIVDAELNVMATLATNVLGSQNVARAALAAGVKRVVGISTDKTAHVVSTYGASKLILERLFQEFSRYELTSFLLCRYGNVLGSTGSVIPVWREMLERDGYVTATDPDMTRFWMTVDEAVDVVLAALTEPSGTVYIPKARALDMRRFAEYTMPGIEFRYQGLRPGEKRHEELLTAEEAPFVEEFENHFRLWPVWSRARNERQEGYTSLEPAAWLTRGELLEMLNQ